MDVAYAQQLRALEYLKLAAEHNNPHALLRLGDYHYYGLGGVAVDLEKAVAYYHYASDMHLAQGTFNMGYMHEHGLGIARDFYLAKRYYDLALAANPDAWLAWLAAMTGLSCRYVYHHGFPTEEVLHSLNLWAAEALHFDAHTTLICFLSLLLIYCLAIRFALSQH